MTNAVSGVEPNQRHLNGPQTPDRELRNLSAPQYGVTQDDDIAVPMRDGVELMADVYRPDAAGRYPALLAFSPYPRQIQNSRIPAGLVEAGSSDFFVPRGYVHVIANARSTGGSGGQWTLLDQGERDDLFDLIEWIAAQPWCDGQVGMLGISYFAMAQLAAAASRAPSLKAIFPLGANESVYDVAWHHGLCVTSFLGPWIGAIGMTSTKTDRVWNSEVLRLASAVVSSAPVHKRLAHLNGEAMLSILKGLLRGHYPAEPFDRLWREMVVEHPVYDDFWAARDTTEALAQVDIPVYLGCDWDNVIMHLPGTFTSWRALAHNPNVRMCLLPEGGLNWPWESMHYEALGWYDHWLKGRDTGIADGPRVRYYLPGADEWRTAETWPPPECSNVEYALSGDGILSPGRPADTADRAYLHQIGDLGRPHNANQAELPDHLQWSTAAADDAVDLVGPMELVLDATITGLDIGWIAILHDVAPDGGEVPISGGWLRATLREVDEDRSTPGVPVVPCRRPQPVPPGEKVTYRIPIVPNARRIRPGHRLRLTLASADQANGPTSILGFTHAAILQPSVNTIHATSRLVVPISRT